MISVATTEKPCLVSNSPTAGPERSTLAPLAQESLMVSTAVVSASGIEEDIFFLFLRAAFIALRFVEQSQALHEQPLSVQIGGVLSGLAFEVDLKIAASPAQHFEDSRVALQLAVGGVVDLAFAEEHFTLVSAVGECELAALAAHFQRLHKVDHIHLR